MRTTSALHTLTERLFTYTGIRMDFQVAGRQSRSKESSSGRGKPMACFLLSALVVGLQVFAANGHGRLLDPPSRASAWRVGFDTPPDYNDNEGFCGGFSYQHEVSGGKCGICGDAWGKDYRAHEAPGGKFATGTIVQEYKAGSIIPITVQLTANHMGYFQFKLCPNNNVKQDPEQDCFDKIVLKTTDGDEKYMVTQKDDGYFNFELMLPAGVTCSQCILQWTYTTGNSWGVSESEGGCLGCGSQETFRACSDISIEGAGSGSVTSEPPVPTSATTTVETEATTAPSTTTTAETPVGGNCVAIGLWKSAPNMNQWCQTNCNHEEPYCPKTHCKCT